MSIFSHWDDLSTLVQETLEAFHGLQKDGKARCFGASNLIPERIQESLEVISENELPKYSVIQPE